MRVVIVLFSILFIGVEIIQVKQLKMSYFEDIWNYILSFSYILNIYVVLEHVYDFSGI